MPRSFRSVGGGSPWGHLDTADTLAVDTSELDVASITPGGVPGVLHEPVVEAGSGVSAESDGGDGVIEGGTASGGVEDTRFVGLEDGLVGLNGDSEEVGDGDGGGGGRVVHALALLAGGAGEVGVDGFELSLVSILVVLVAVLLEATLAAVVAVAGGEAGAINELLLREGEELTLGDEMGTLKRGDRGESPA